MYKYYLFVIKPEVAHIYRNNLKELGLNLYELSSSKSNNVNYKISLFKQLCLPFKIQVINDYFKYLSYLKNNNNKYLYKSKQEISLIKLRYSVIIIYSNKIWPHFFNFFKICNQNILVCDFINNKYFWLTK